MRIHFCRQGSTHQPVRASVRFPERVCTTDGVFFGITRNGAQAFKPPGQARWRGFCALTVSGTALAAGFSQLFREQIPVASAIPLTKSTPFGAGPVAGYYFVCLRARACRLIVVRLGRFCRRSHASAFTCIVSHAAQSKVTVLTLVPDSLRRCWSESPTKSNGSRQGTVRLLLRISQEPRNLSDDENSFFRKRCSRKV